MPVQVLVYVGDRNTVFEGARHHGSIEQSLRHCRNHGPSEVALQGNRKVGSLLLNMCRPLRKRCPVMRALKK